MASNPYVNKVVYGNQTVLDLTGDTASADDVLSGQTFHDRSGALVIGTASRATNITPSDSSPVALTANTPVNPTTSGYAIESNPTSVTPSSSGEYFASGITKMTTSGYAYSSQQTIVFTTVTSSFNGVGAEGWSYSSLNANYTYILSVMAVPNSGYRQKMYYIKNRTISKTIADTNGRSDVWNVSISGSTVSVSRTGSVVMHIMLVRLT